MATYKQIFGKQVKFLSSDPANEAEGQVWYNSTSGTFKTVVNSGAWSSSSPISTARLQSAGTGTQTSSLLMAGNIPPYPTATAVVEEYNGTGWSNQASIPTATMGGGGAGTVTSALFAGGFVAPPPPGQTATYEFDGSTWTGGGVLNFGRTNIGSGGSQTAAIVFCGSEASSPNPSNKAEEYNGTSWTAGGDLGNARYGMGAGNVGLQTATLAIGGGMSPYTDKVEEYNGTSWSETTVIPTASSESSRWGTTTAAVYAGGYPTPGMGGKNFHFDGSTWTAAPDMAYPRAANPGTGTTTAGLVAGSDPFVANTEEYNVGTTVVVPGAWASAPALNTARTLGGSALPAQNAGIIFGGSAPYTGATEQYNGSAWTTSPGSLNTARGYNSGFGTETAAVCAGGYNDTLPSGTSGMAVVEEWNGTAWSEETNIPANRKNCGNCGIITAGLLMGGSTQQPFAPNVVDTTFEYDGTNWTTVNTMPGARGQGMSGGTQTAAFYAGGRTAPAYVATTIEYDGTNWTAGGDLAFGAGPPSGFQGSIGTLTAGLAASGIPSTNLANTYDGSVWSTAPSYTTQRNRGFSGGTGAAAIIAGGSGGPGYVDATEEFTAETTAANYKTITTS